MSDADIEAVAKLANAHEFIGEMSDGYEAQVGEKGVQLSGIVLFFVISITSHYILLV